MHDQISKEYEKIKERQLMADFIDVEVEHFNPHNSWEHIHKVINEIESEGFWVNRVLGDLTICNDKGKTIVNNPNHEGGIDGYVKICVEFINTQYSFKG